ncbi:hypothetical protein MHB46_24130 [Paenibacillus sp. FSL H7-0703]|uniref:hypothetical protein n=1 Tax=Paenibacillus sp. FSL H7-0703 TaxID=2921438 RepID=UPI0030FAF0A3
MSEENKVLVGQVQEFDPIADSGHEQVLIAVDYTENLFRYSGEWDGVTGLQYMRNRWYDQTKGYLSPNSFTEYSETARVKWYG